MQGFQSTLPREERPMLLYRSAVMLLFQSTLPREERRSLWLLKCGIRYFNPRSHERSDLSSNGMFLMALVFQSTLPREERPIKEDVKNYIDDISIHAPTRGATKGCVHRVSCHSISIHAPTRGATILLSSN